MITKDEQGRMTVDGYELRQLAKQFGTPLYVYSQARITDNVTRLKQALENHFSSPQIQYAIKANSNPHIAQLMAQLHLGADCSSPAEAQLAKSAGFAMERSTYTGNFESSDDFHHALKHQMICNLDDHHRLDDLLAQGKPQVLSFRINPGIGRGGFEGIVTGGNDAKFGIPYEQTGQAYQQAMERGIKRFGIHMMTGSNILEPFYFAEITQKLLSIIETYLGGCGLELEFINIGGGLGIPYSPGDKALDVRRTFKLVADVLHAKIGRMKIGNPSLVVEPGRYLVGDAGILLSRVTHVKKSYHNYVGLDSSMSTLLRPALYRAFHQIHLDGKTLTHPQPYQVCGQVCENSDIHPRPRLLQNPAPGDLAVIDNVGAYGFAMSSHYNGRPRPGEVLIGRQGPKVIRQAESIQDIFAQIPDFSF